MNFKKLGLIVLFAAVTGAAGYFLFRLFFAGPPAPPVEEPGVVIDPLTGLPVAAPGLPPGIPGVEPGIPVGLPPAVASPIASGGPTQTQLIDDARILAPTISTTGRVTYHNEFDGKFYTVLPDGTVSEMSSREFPGARNVVWSPQADKAVIEFPDESKVIFDFATQRQVTLPRHWQEFSFSSDGGMIAAKSMSFNPENRWLITMGSDGSNPRLVEHMGENADKVTVSVSPDGAVIAFAQTGDPVGFDAKEVLLIGQNDENYKALRVDGFGFQPKWSPTGTHLLYSASAAAEGYRPTLWFVAAKGDAIGQGRTKIPLNTWADKCTFANSTTVYCAVPDELPEGVGLQRDLAVGTADSIWRVDLSSGAVRLVGKPEDDSTTIGALVVPSDESRLFFVDQRTGELRSMLLK